MFDREGYSPEFFRLIEYEQEEISETTKVVNPLYRELESKIKTKTTLLNRQRVNYGALVLKAEGEEPDIRNPRSLLV